ncbi:sigma-70 family RNA polymerase sigma factor [Xanthomonas sp. AmX2]|uniref:RNA polymerase sigma factor n=1 Tax=Xanthomonas sp. TaxID=29446 RepID=UPI00197E3D15|nr:sigma-70 family RNA polymerase sigma factor [Xanthomonas sp.]MBN6150931.1 sigma-70 family RNA polymerase sigma factor [Xanthomonas sp.]
MSTVSPPLELLLQRELPAAARGCQHAYGRVVAACQNTVSAIALAITRDVQASEDIAQEAFLKAWQQLSRLNSHASFLPWLRQITRNLARDWLRAQRGRPMSGEAAEIALTMAADPAPSPAERLLRLEEEIVAADIISALPEDSRETLLLYYREGQQSQQVAALLGLSDAAVRKRLSRARASVREELLQRFGDFARGSAPGAAFAATLASSLLLAAPGTAGAAILYAGGAGSLGAGKLGAGGLGVSSLSGGTALGSLGALASQGSMLQGHQWAAMLCGLVGGMLGAYLGGLYLLRYAESAHERASVRRFIHLNTGSAAAICVGTALLEALGAAPGLALGFLAAGMLVINYQCLFPLQRIMAPLLARDAARHGRRGPTWLYHSLYGRPAIVATNVLVVAAVALGEGWIG